MLFLTEETVGCACCLREAGGGGKEEGDVSCRRANRGVEGYRSELRRGLRYWIIYF